MARPRRFRALIGTFALVAASVAGSAYYVYAEISYRLLKSAAYRQQVTIPQALLPNGVRQPQIGQPIGPADQPRLAAAIWREPMQQPLANTLYVAMKDRQALPGLTERQVALLSALGWRNIASQQNLLIHDLIDRPRLDWVVDRGDALLRRRKVLPFANQMLAILEANPEANAQMLIVQRLAQRPPWRSDYLVATSQAAAPDFLTTRARTLQMLMRIGSKVSPREIAPVLSGLVASGNTAMAYNLWLRFAGRTNGKPIVNDGDFQELGSRGLDMGPILPFDWQLQEDLGSNTAPADDGKGVTIDWNGRGVPVFLSQFVPVEAGDRYILTISGEANAIDMGNLLTPTLACNGHQVPFDGISGNADTATFRSDLVPRGCPIAQLVIAARPRDSTSPVSATLRRIIMRTIR